MLINLTEQQKKLINNLLSSLGSKVIKVSGFAGTGKTTTICEFRKRLLKHANIAVAFVTFTGKASSVLRSKLGDALQTQDYCGTIHGLIYKPVHKWSNNLKSFIVTSWILSDKINYDLIIIDEASMISKDIWNDLCSFDIPIIAFGDHGQLPPIGDKFDLMSTPDFLLTEIHRQNLESPIIKLSKFVRERGFIPYGFYSKNVFKLRWNTEKCKQIWNSVNMRENNVVVICGFNTTRCNLNDHIRKKLKYIDKVPFPGEKIVCLANNHQNKIMNGQIGKVLWVVGSQFGYRITLDIDGNIHDLLISDKCFGQVVYTIYDKTEKQSKKTYKKIIDLGFSQLDYYDYGYVISVHKSQGSEWDKVILFEQRTSRWDDEYYTKWLYTAVTRAREKLFIIGDAWI